MTASQTTFFTEKGDVSLPLNAASVDIPIGQNTPQPAVVTTFHATGASVLDGAVSGAGFVAAVQAISGAGQTVVTKENFLAPLPADLISISAAALATNRALTIAAQPPQSRKLQIRQVIVTAITAGVLTIIGTDQDGNAVTEAISLIAAATQTLTSKWAYAGITSATVTALAGGGDGTLGLGLSNDFGVSCGQGAVSNFAIVKATKVITTVTGGVTAWARAVTDDVASTAVVDATARTVKPTTAPGVAGINDYEFTVSFNLAA